VYSTLAAVYPVEVSLLSQRVDMINAHYKIVLMPPDQPKDYTPLVHQEQYTKQQDSEMAKLTQTGDIDSIASGQLRFPNTIVS